MIKKLLPAMIGAALVGGMSVAAADVTVMGHIDTSVVNFDIDQSGVGNDVDDTNFVCTTCSIGFKGSEDLGNGLKAIFQLDFQYDTTTRNRVAPVTKGLSGGSGSLTDRDQWLGLAGGYGKVRVGTISTHYKSHGAMIDPLYRTVAQGRDRGLQSEFHSGAGEELQGRATNTLRYDSPNYSGFKAGFHYTLDSGSNKNIGVTSEDDNPWGIGGSYENGGILVFADYMTNDGSASTVNADITAWKLGGKYSMDAFAVMAQYEDAEFDDGVSTDATVWHLAASYTMGNNMLYLGYGQGNEDEPGFDEDYDALTVAGTHSMSKRTTAYAAYTTVDCDADLSTSVCNGMAATGGDNSVFAVGLKHKF